MAAKKSAVCEAKPEKKAEKKPSPAAKAPKAKAGKK